MDGTGATGGLSRVWCEIGSGSKIELRSVGLWIVELPLLRPLVTAKGVHRSRPLVLVQVIGECGGTTVEGWGECAALADTTYDREDVTGSFEDLERLLVPALFEEADTMAYRLPLPSALDRVRRAAPEHPLAFASLEMAVADAHLRAEGRSLAGVLGVEERNVELGAVVGRCPSTAGLVAQVGALVEAGFTRVKVKIAPGWDVDPLDAVSRAFPKVRLQADANGSYSDSDRSHLAALDRFNLLCLEQPFDPADLAAHVRLAEQIKTPVCLDEGVSSPAAIDAALAMGACSVVCVKPARIGGLGAALEVIESCARSGVPLWIGGMFESGYGRGINTTLAALPAFSWPGDLSPARSYLRDDLVPGLRPSRTGPERSLVASPPRGPGMGPPPQRGSIERHLHRHVVIEAPTR